MDNIQKQVVERLKQANNILVTVRNDPSIDLLSACIALALALDKMDKHATAVFSGQVPSAMEFLKPESTIERTPDSLRDFIIALDKSKADKLRYKVEDEVVRIFITPYKTSLSEKDLEFSQGDFNVDAIVALGAHAQEELDQAITVHGRILHDATIVSINNTPNGSLGSLNWQDTGASSISEMVSKLVEDLGKEIVDGQIATALLTGIVAETARFSNDKTSPETMSVAGRLMAAGANQQLVATSLQTTQPEPPSSSKADEPASPADEAKPADDGTLDIDHEDDEEPSPPEKPEPEEPEAEHPSDEQPELPEPSEPPAVKPAHDHELLPMEPPHISMVHGAPLPEAQFTPEYAEEIPSSVRSYLVDDPAIPAATPKPSSSPVVPSEANPFQLPETEPAAPIIERDGPAKNKSSTAAQDTGLPPISDQPAPPPDTPAPAAPTFHPTPWTPPVSDQPAAAAQSQSDDETLEEIEESVHSPHINHTNDTNDVDSARSQVANAFQQAANPPLEPLAALNANPLGGSLHGDQSAPATPPQDSTPIEVDADGNLKLMNQQQPSIVEPSDEPADKPLPPVSGGVFPPVTDGSSAAVSSLPPSSPPPLTPPSFGSPSAS